MVGMAALPVGKNDHAWTVSANYARNFQAVVVSVFDAAIRNVEGCAPGDLRILCRVDGLVGAVFGSAAAASSP